MKIALILISLLFVVTTLICVVLYISYNNDYVSLKNRYEAQEAVDKAIFDEVWKVIQQQAGVSQQYSKDFKDNYQAIMQSRNYGGELMKWITEQNPTFTPDLYSKLMNTIESQRSKFTSNQKTLIAIHKELKDLVMKFPGSIILSGKEIPELKIVTSAKTEGVFTSGQDNDVNLFK